MLSTNIEAEFDIHIKRVKGRLFDEFQLRMEDEIAKSSKGGFLEKSQENPINRSKVFFDLIDAQYTSVLRETIEEIKQLFDNHDIGFRLLDINYCIHGYHRMTFIWVEDGREYVFDFLFDSDQHNPFEPFYRLGEIDGCGTPVNGDILHSDSQRLFSEQLDLPYWFVRGLQKNS